MKVAFRESSVVYMSCKCVQGKRRINFGRNSEVKAEEGKGRNAMPSLWEIEALNVLKKFLLFFEYTYHKNEVKFKNYSWLKRAFVFSSG